MKSAPKKPKASKPSELLSNTTEAARKQLRELLSPKQLAYFDDPARFKLARCGRRAGKTFVVAAGHIDTCLQYPGDTTVYFGMTLDAAKEAIWDAALGLLNKIAIPHTFSEAKLEIYFANGSRFKLLGADMANIRKRLRGRRFRKVSVDECAFFASGGIDNLILDVLLPTTADFRAPMEMTSSPGELPQGLFWEADQGEEKESWSQHHWTMHDNLFFQGPSTDPQFATHAEEEFDLVCRFKFKGDRDHPSFRREYLGEWVFNKRTRTYPLSETDVITKQYKLKGEQYAVGINVSNVSEQSAVVIKYGEYDRDIQVIEAYKFKAADLTELANEVQELIDSYDAMVVHCYLGDLEPDAIDNFKKRYKIPLLSSRFQKTSYNQRVIATDMNANHVKVMDDCKELIDEFNKIVKNEEGQELPNQQTLVADAFFAVYSNIYNMHLKTVAPQETEDQMIERRLLEAVQQELDEHSEDYGYTHYRR